MNDEQSKFMKRSAFGTVVLIFVYIFAMSLGNTLFVALSELGRWWAYVAALSVGFGIQVGLYMHIRDFVRAAGGKVNGSRMAMSGGVSATSMVVCCLHHVTDVLPILGLSAASLFLANYQSVFMSLGVLSSIVGTTVMLEQLHMLGAVDALSVRLGKTLAWYDLNRVKKVFLWASALIFVVLLAGALGAPSVSASNDGLTVEGSEAGVTFTIMSVDYGDTLGFQMSIDTHQGALDFDLTEISTLEVGGVVYEPLSWGGSSPGGHHRSGELIFPKPNESGQYTLTIRDVHGVPQRIFNFGTASSGSAETYIMSTVLIIAAVALFLGFRSKRSSEEYYQSMFEAEQRRFRMGDTGG
jgi:hypothetical protein